MTGYISLMALGVPMACVRYLAQDVAEGDARKMNQTIGSCAGLYLLIGIAAVLIGAGLMVAFNFYEIPASFETEALLAFGLMVINVSAGFIGLLPEGILFAHHDFVRRNLVRMTGVLLRLGLTIGLLKLEASLVTLAAVQIACPRLRLLSHVVPDPPALPGSSRQPRRLRDGHGPADFRLQRVRAVADRRSASQPSKPMHW